LFSQRGVSLTSFVPSLGFPDQNRTRRSLQ
jgi:hypothetical protein